MGGRAGSLCLLLSGNFLSIKEVWKFRYVQLIVKYNFHWQYVWARVWKSKPQIQGQSLRSKVRVKTLWLTYILWLVRS